MAALLAEVRMKKKQHAQMMEAVEKIKNIFLQLSAEDTEVAVLFLLELSCSFK